MNSMIHTSDNLFCWNSIVNLPVKFASQICHENINKPLDSAYLADFGIDINFTIYLGWSMEPTDLSVKSMKKPRQTSSPRDVTNLEQRQNTSSSMTKDRRWEFFLSQKFGNLHSYVVQWLR